MSFQDMCRVCRDKQEPYMMKIQDAGQEPDMYYLTAGQEPDMNVLTAGQEPGMNYLKAGLEPDMSYLNLQDFQETGEEPDKHIKKEIWRMESSLQLRRRLCGWKENWPV